MNKIKLSYGCMFMLLFTTPSIRVLELDNVAAYVIIFHVESYKCDSYS